LGALNAEIFVERVNSQVKLVCTNANTLLLDEEISMLFILHMNESFMMHMHQHYSTEIKKLGLKTCFGWGIAVDNPDNPDGLLVLE
jgi:hypothetical protein